MDFDIRVLCQEHSTRMMFLDQIPSHRSARLHAFLINRCILQYKVLLIHIFI